MAGSGFIYNTRRKCQAIAAKVLRKEFLNKVYTKLICGYKPNIKNPKTFNEKIQWLKLYYFPNNPKAIAMTDKVQIHKVIEEMGIDVKLPNLLFESTSYKDIPWDNLPDKFVLKCNHGCAYNIVCVDKNSLNKKKATKKIKKWLKENFGLFNIEPHYSKIKRKVFAEEYLGEELIDYKFFCFNGEPKFLYVSKDLVHDSTAQISYFDLNWQRLPLVRDDYKPIDNIDKPSCFNKLIELSKQLSKDFPFVRVDFYVIHGKPYLSEMTFTPSAGMMPINPRRFDREWGDLLNISNLASKF